MGKLDELRRTAGANITESASKRDTTLAPIAPTLASLSPARMAGVARSKSALEIPVDRIEPDPDQPREDFDEVAMARLADSLKQRGQLQPVRVRWDEGRGIYVLICGERRWMAARMAGLPTLTCVVAEGTLDAGELLAIQLVENCVREDLQPIEQARAYRALMDRTGWSGNRLAQELGIAQSSVVHALALLELPSGIQEKVEQGELSPSTAYEISKAPDVESQVEVATRVVADGLTRSEAIEAVRQAAGRRPSQKTAKGRGAKARKVTERTFRTSAGYKITIENRRGIEPPSLAAALRETFDRVEAEIQDDKAEGAAA
ncbi:MAG: ParB/RepB/Spo0J family partition protein [Isosphaeraceae bacterium]